ncbi:hypothetical protein MTO96_032004 [Rhipicephalus appendiculatus]
MSRLLAVRPVHNLQDTERLRTLYDELQTGVRSLEALGVASSTYGVLLLTVLRKSIPNELCLEYYRRKTTSEAVPEDDLQQFLNFLKAENWRDNTRVRVEALEIPEISGDLLPPPDDHVAHLMREQGLVLAYTVPDGYQPGVGIELLVGADHYWDVTTGSVKRVNERLVAVETVLGWVLQGTDTTSSASTHLKSVGVMRHKANQKKNLLKETLKEVLKKVLKIVLKKAMNEVLKKVLKEALEKILMKTLVKVSKQVKEISNEDPKERVEGGPEQRPPPQDRNILNKHLW